MLKPGVLIVEDEEVLRIDLEEQLKRLNYSTVASVNTGEAAIKAVSVNKPDIILMDIYLKGRMNGFETTKLIKSQYDIPIIFLSSHADDKLLEKAKLLNPNGYLIKPVKEHELKVSIEMAMYIAEINHKRSIAEVALKESEEKYKQFVENTDDLITQVDKEGCFSYVSPSCIKYYGLKPEDCIGRSAFDFIHPEDKSTTLESFNDWLKSGSPGFSYMNRQVSTDGHVFHMLWTISLIKDPHGNIKWINSIARDVTTEQNAKESLLKHATLLREIGKIARVGGWELDLKTNELLWSNQVYELHEVEEGFKPDLDSAKKFYHPDSLQILDHAISRAIETGSTYDLELQLVTAKGRSIWVRTQGRIQFENNTPVRLTGSIQDITKRKNAQIELQVQKDIFSMIFETAPYIMMIINKEGRVENINRHGIDFSGREKKEILGLLGGDVLKCLNSFEGLGCGRNEICDDCPIRTRIMRTLHTGEPIYDEEICLEIHDLELKKVKIYFLISTSRFEIKDTFFVLTTLNDITTRIRANEALKISEQRFREFFDRDSSYCYIVSPDGLLIDVNRAAIQALGYKNKEELVGEPFIEKIYAPESVEKATQLFLKFKNTGELNQEEMNIVTKSGEKRTVLLSASAVRDKNGQLIHSTSVQTDITLRKAATELVRESEERYRAMFEGNAMPMLLIDPGDGTIIDANKAACDFYGWTHDELRSKKINDINILSEYEIIEEMNYAIEVKRRHYNFKHTLACGDTRDVEVYSGPISIKGKQLLYSSIVDVTRRRQAESELRKLSRATEASPVSIVITDADGTIEYVNPKFSEVSGYGPEEAIGKNPRILKSGEQSEQFYRELWNTIKNGEIWRGEFRNCKKNGNLHWESASISPILNKLGEITNFVGVKEDITDRKEIEAALQISQERYSLATSAGMVGVWDWKIYENEFYMDSNIKKMLGYTDKEIPNDFEVWTTYVFPEDQDSVRKALQDYIEGKTQEYVVEHRMNHKNGSIRWILVHGKAILSEQGKAVRVVGTNTDITDRKNMEMALHTAKDLAEQANQSKSAFLANMSHELRTPLNGIIGFTQILQKQLTDSLSEKQLKFFNTIKNSGDHLLEMVNDILDLSKIEAGKVELDLKPFDFGKMLKRSPSVILALAQKKDILVEIDIPDNLGWINGDETKLKQVIYNLLSNAVKFTDAGKRIGIEARITGDFFNVVVWDEGAGIPENYLEKIFNPFEQVKENSKSNEKGSGLGLAISKRLLELHKGAIKVESTIGEGSRFEILLPDRFIVDELKGKIKIEEPQPTKSGLMSKLEILVTEDNEDNRELIKAALEDFNLDFAETGEAAVMMASKKIYDLVLMDIQLPGISGNEAMKKIKNQSDKHIPVIAVTAFAMKGDEEKYLKVGFDKYLSKPINIDILLETIREVLHLPNEV